MIEDLKNFLFRGNIVELAVAFVMGVAFAAVITSLVDNLIMPIIAMIIGKPDFSDLTFTINDAVFRYGAFLTAAIQFIAIAAASGVAFASQEARARYAAHGSWSPTFQYRVENPAQARRRRSLVNSCSEPVANWGKTPTLSSCSV